MPTTKIDLTRELKELYLPGRDPVLIDVPEFSFLMIDGHGDPTVAPSFRKAIEALYTLSYTIKFAIKSRSDGLDYKVMPLEGLWSAQDMSAFTAHRRSEWEWTMMIRQPPEAGTELLERAVEEVRRKKGIPDLDLLRLERLAEGPAVQLMYRGPYSQEGPAIARLHEFIREQGRRPSGRHHEIYLGDPRRAAPEKLRTVLRQPVAHPASGEE